MRLWFQRVGAVLVALRRGRHSDVETARQLMHCALDLLPFEQRVKLITEFAINNSKQARGGVDSSARRRRAASEVLRGQRIGRA